ncbi:erythromycin esterase family protein [Paenibacillus cremeus]|uniref:Erythromycin esterase family protein n=1 Tax=Paenibacillus cremeus TaxID=2163881 RepID=A0A559KDP3_9BACL|nr:erythromycin esterase family protein [Paenibacillus cremeus]TVY10251.1 erythromycin esterase family protein [Paenibacillus cremeus]
MQAATTKLIHEIRRLSLPLRSPDDLSPLVEAAGEAKYVLLGEASHGTSEFYTVRAELTKRLILEHGCRFIAVEGDWPACFSVNRYVKSLPGAAADAKTALQAFDRWPVWMWANHEILELIEWLKAHNDALPAAERVGFYGMDVYSLWESMEEIIQYLERIGSKHVEDAREAFACFEPFHREGQNYGVSAALYGEGCTDEVVALLTKLRTDRGRVEDPQEAALDAEINGLVTLHAEQYYRAMITADAESWNIRDRHMVEALQRIAAFYGPGAKAVVWEHNTHIGDARSTDMLEDGMVNVGQLLREQSDPGEVFAIGFGTHRGTVMAASRWGVTPEVMQVPAGIRDSWEDLLHESLNGADHILLFAGRDAPALMDTVIGHRAIGVVYHPRRERGNYVPTVLPQRYDAFVHMDATTAVKPLAGIPVMV